MHANYTTNDSRKMYVQSVTTNLPATLKDVPAFVNYSNDNPDYLKAPRSPYSRKLFQNYQTDTASFNVALKNVADGKADAIGIFADATNEIVVVDYDHVLDSQGNFISQKSKDFFDQMSPLQTYIEFSMSDTGLHAVYFMATDEKKKFVEKYGTKKKKISFDDGSDVEIFVTTQATRLTGKLFSEQTNAIASISFDMLDAIIPVQKKENLNTTQFSHNSGFLSSDIISNRLQKKLDDDPKFRACWNGDASYFNNDDSSADMSLIQNLCFICEGNETEIYSLFRQSPAFQSVQDRKKNHAEDYINRTIDKACKSYSPNFTFHKKPNKLTDKSNRDILCLSEERTGSICPPGHILDEKVFFVKEETNMIQSKEVPIDYSGTDYSNAEWFVELFGDVIKYNLDSKMFMLWNPEKFIWQEVDAVVIKNNVSVLAKLLSNATAKTSESFAKFYHKKSLYLQSEQGISRCIKLVKAQKRIHVSNDLFNRHAWILPCVNGYIDLSKLNKNHESSDYFITDEKTCRELYFTKSTNIPFNPYVENLEHFQDSLLLVLDTFEFPFSPDETHYDRYDDQRELFKLLACCLVGENLNNKFVICYGNGANGKSVILNAVMETLGDFATVADANQFVKSNSRFESRKSADPGLAELEGMRFVLATDGFDQTKKLSAEIIKLYTSQELIVARKLHENNRKFKPTWTVFTMWNDFPSIAGNESQAMRRRLATFGFSKTVPERLQDKKLLQKLTSDESKQVILCLLLKFLRLYFIEGLKETESMKSMRIEMLEQDNILKIFIEKFYDFDQTNMISLKDFIDKFRDEYPSTRKKNKQIEEDLCNMVWERFPDRNLDIVKPYETKPKQIIGLKLKS